MSTIAFDIDGVLANFTRGFTRVGHRIFGTPVGDTSTQESWDFHLYPALQLDKVQSGFDGPIWTAIKESPDFWALLDPINVSVMHRINKIQNKIFITNRPGINTVEQSRYFLETWGIEEPEIIVASKKGPVAVEREVVAVIDDLYTNIVDIKAAVPTCYAGLLYCNYNRVHFDTIRELGGEILLSVDQFVDECYARGLVVEKPVDENATDEQLKQLLIDFPTVNSGPALSDIVTDEQRLAIERGAPRVTLT